MKSSIGIDQGTSGTTVVVIDPTLQIRSIASRPIGTLSGRHGSVEQDPWAVLQSIVDATAEAIDSASPHTEFVTAGFAHQGETVLAWDSESLDPLTPAIVWSDRRADSVVRDLTQRSLAKRVASLSGMRLDSYFCAAKYRWMLDSHTELAEMADRGQVRLGTLETWLLTQLGLESATDGGTASRTQLVRLGESAWNSELLEIFGLDISWLAPIVRSVGYRGDLTSPAWSIRLPLHSVMVDQPAALIGTGGTNDGNMKVTYGTGAFVVANAGRIKTPHQVDIVASVGWTDPRGPTFTLDGGVLSAGSALDWLGRLGVDVSPAAHNRIIGSGPSSVRVLPAFHGLGAPSWDRSAHASIGQLQSDSMPQDLLHGFLDSIAFSVREIVDAMADIGVPRPPVLRADGGLSRSTYLMQCQSDVLGMPVAVGASVEATAIGAAMMAGASVGIWDIEAVSELANRSTRTFVPTTPEPFQSAFTEWADAYRSDSLG